MIELRWLVPEGTFIPGKEYPKLQYRVLKTTGWSEWIDVPTVKDKPKQTITINGKEVVKPKSVTVYMGSEHCVDVVFHTPEDAQQFRDAIQADNKLENKVSVDPYLASVTLLTHGESTIWKTGFINFEDSIKNVVSAWQKAAPGLAKGWHTATVSFELDEKGNLTAVEEVKVCSWGDDIKTRDALK